MPVINSQQIANIQLGFSLEGLVMPSVFTTVFPETYIMNAAAIAVVLLLASTLLLQAPAD